MKKPITEKEYKRRGGQCCPVCRVVNEAEGGPLEVQGSLVYQEMNCLSCGATWADWYKIDGYNELKAGA